MKVDLVNIIGLSTSLAPAARTTSENGTGVALAGFNSAVVFFHVGAITDGTHTPKIQESDDNSTYTDVAAGDLIGSLSALAASTNQKVGYKGSKAYIRAVSTITGSPSTGGVYAATVVRGDAIKQPVS